LRDPSLSRIRRFGQALVLARELPAEVGWLHAHFLHTPASVTRYAAMITGLSWSVSAHAKDVWTTPDWEKREKLADCRWLVTCTRSNAEHLSRLAPDAGRVHLVYHGLDLARFPPPPQRLRHRNGSSADDPVVLLSVGRLVEKKGYPVLLDALALLPADLCWRFVHIGGGPLLPSLQRQAEAHGLERKIRWLGAQPQDRVLSELRAADLFVLAARIANDGDRDGLPNVLMEAQSQGLACVSSRIAAIPELIIDGETGLLVAPDDPAALAGALARLITDPELRHRLGHAGLVRVHSMFRLEDSIGELAARFGLSPNHHLAIRPSAARPSAVQPSSGPDAACVSPFTRR
jgi:glycosyltransferase involved in cell wall biosynthesis